MNYSGISECDVLNGIGFRVVLFVSGCDHMCCNCQNPNTWNENFGHPFTEETKQYLFECLDKPYIDGITITGGDPLYETNLDEVMSLVREIHVSFPQKTIWLYTGYEWEEVMECSDIPGEDDIDYGYYIVLENENRDTRKKILSLCDVLVDGRYIDSQRNVSLKWRGSSNQRVIDVQESLKRKDVLLWCD